MLPAYHIGCESNPPDSRPSDVPTPPLYHPPEPGRPSTPPDMPVTEPPLQPPVTDVPPATTIPGPIGL